MTPLARKRVSAALLGAMPFAATGLLWTVATRTLDVPSHLLPSPAAVLAEFARQFDTGEIWRNVWLSLSTLLTGVAIGTSAGLVLGTLMGSIRPVARFFDPLVIFFQSIAGIAWVPLAIVWFGFGTPTIIFVVSNIVFFSVLFNTISGIERVPTVLKQAVLTLGGSRIQIFMHVVLPGALANVLVGLRTAFAFGWRSLVSVEIIAASAGLGFSILDAAQRYDSARIVCGILTVGAIWLIMESALLRTLERRTVERWGLVRNTGE
jgi:NitT/TauT family transport system permease protein/taurine transport system permease protein